MCYLDLFIILYVWVFCLHACLYTCVPGTHCRVVRCPGVTDLCELPRGFWVLNSGSLQEQQVHLTVGPSLQYPLPYSHFYEVFP